MKQKHLMRIGRLRSGWPYILFGVMLLAIGTYVYVTQHKMKSRASTPLAAQPAPSSVRPSSQSIDTHVVPAGNPKYLAIPAIDVRKTRILQRGLLSNGAIAAPDNIYDAGWYDASAKPGQNGAMFISGHVSSWEANGIFYDLKRLTRGNTVEITDGADKKYTYQVVSIKWYPYDKVDMDQVLRPVDPGKPGLNLMTCAGPMIKGTSEFSERLVVFTSLVTS